MCKVSALRKTGWEQTDINQCHQARPQTLKTFQPVIDFGDTVDVNHAHIVQGQLQRKV